MTGVLKGLRRKFLDVRMVVNGEIGLFMGLLVGFILISILSVGLSAIGSLQVSYGAFDKEMGPAAQKKQQ